MKRNAELFILFLFFINLTGTTSLVWIGTWRLSLGTFNETEPTSVEITMIKKERKKEDLFLPVNGYNQSTRWFFCFYARGSGKKNRKSRSLCLDGTLDTKVITVSVVSVLINRAFQSFRRLGRRTTVGTQFILSVRDSYEMCNSDQCYHLAL